MRSHMNSFENGQLFCSWDLQKQHKTNNDPSLDILLWLVCGVLFSSCPIWCECFILNNLSKMCFFIWKQDFHFFSCYLQYILLLFIEMACFLHCESKLNFLLVKFVTNLTVLCTPWRQQPKFIKKRKRQKMLIVSCIFIVFVYLSRTLFLSLF